MKTKRKTYKKTRNKRVRRKNSRSRKRKSNRKTRISKNNKGGAQGASVEMQSPKWLDNLKSVVPGYYLINKIPGKVNSMWEYHEKVKQQKISNQALIARAANLAGADPVLAGLSDETLTHLIEIYKKARLAKKVTLRQEGHIKEHQSHQRSII